MLTQNAFQSLPENTLHKERKQHPFHILLSHSSYNVHLKIAYDPTGGPKRPGRKIKDLDSESAIDIPSHHSPQANLTHIL